MTTTVIKKTIRVRLPIEDTKVTCYSKYASINNSCRQGTLRIALDQLKTALGLPNGRPCDTVTAEWLLKSPFGTVSIYDYKQATAPTRIHDWSVGGHMAEVARWVRDYVLSRLGDNTINGGTTPLPEWYN
jgi:hypothetical protein